MTHLLKLSVLKRKTWNTFRKIFRQIKVFLAKRGFLVGGTHSSLATRALIAFKLKKPNIATVKWGKFVRLLEILPN